MKQTKIEWTEATWNPSIGCDKVSAGCKNCYAETMAKRLQAMRARGYEEGFKFKVLPERLDAPARILRPTIFFVNSMSDLFHEEMPFEFLDEIFHVIANTPRHTYQILTKRDDVLVEYFKTRPVPPNAWLGVTVEEQKRKTRIDNLRSVDAKVKLLSLEPLLESLGELDLNDIDWVIVGGESGHRARPMRKEWVEEIQNQCLRTGVPFFFKQWGTWGSDGVKRNKKGNGRTLNGVLYDERPRV